MKFLIDADLSPKIAPALVTAGHQAEHVVDHGLLDAADQQILAFAQERSYVMSRRTPTLSPWSRSPG